MRSLVFSFVTFLHATLALFDEDGSLFVDHTAYCSECDELGVEFSDGQAVLGPDGVNMLYFEKVCWPPDRNMTNSTEPGGGGGGGRNDTNCTQPLETGLFLELHYPSCRWSTENATSNMTGRTFMISAELSPLPEAPSLNASNDTCAILERNLTSTFITWTLPPFENFENDTSLLNETSPGNWTYRTPDLSGLLEELYNRTNRTDCAPLTLFIEEGPGFDIIDNLTNSTVTAVVQPDDNAARESSFAIYDADGNVVVRERKFADDRERISFDELMPGECYTLEVMDEGCDGICCSNGEGFLEIQNNGNTLVTVSRFECDTTEDFCVPQADYRNETVPCMGMYGNCTNIVFDDASLIVDEYCLDDNSTTPTLTPTPPPEPTCVDIDMIDENGLTCPYYDRYPDQCGNTEADEYCLACGGGCCPGEDCASPDPDCVEDDDFKDSEGKSCDWYAVKPETRCLLNRPNEQGRTGLQECCACDIDLPLTPTFTPTISPTAPPSETPIAPTEAPTLPTTPTLIPTVSPTEPYCGYEADPNISYEPDDRIQALFSWCKVNGELRWYHGRILQNNGDGTYRVQFDDGEIQERYSWRWMSPEYDVARDAFVLWEVVEVDYDGEGWREAMVRVVHSDRNGTYSVEFTDNKEVATYVPISKLRARVKFSRGDLVEARVCKWVAATITNVIPDGRYELTVTRGDKADKTNAEFKDLRPYNDWRPNIACFVDVFINGAEYSEGLVIEYNDESDTYDIFITELGVKAVPLSDILPNRSKPCPNG